MMSQTDLNKQYIRESISPAQQQAFYDFFTQIDDHEQFEQWQLPKVIQIVSEFKAHQNIQSTPPIHKLELPDINPSQNTTPTKPSVPQNTADGSQSYKDAIASPKIIGTHQKYYTSLNLLNELECQKAIHAQTKPSSKTSEGWFLKNEDWFKVADMKSLKTAQLSKPEDDIFKTFDAFISETKTESKKGDVDKMKMMRESVKSNGSDGVKKENSVQRDDKSMKGEKRLKDKMFKWKFHEEIKCRKLEKQSVFTDVSITSHEMVHRIFLPDYAMYCIKVFPSNMICKRTYDDFVKLRINLEKMHPVMKIPYLESSSWLSESDIVLINKNKSHLEFFLRGIIEHPDLSKSPIFKAFLTIEDHKTMKKKNEEFQKIGQVTSLVQIATSTGRIDLELTEEQQKLIEKLPKWEEMIDVYFEKYIDLAGTLTTQFEAINQTLSHLSSLASEMNVQLSQIGESMAVIESQQEFSLFFHSQEAYYERRRKQIEVEVKNMKDKFLPFLKYEKLNINLFTPMMKEVNNLTEKYIKRLQNEPESPSSVEQSYQQNGESTTFKQGIWQQSQNMQIFKYQIAYLNSQLLAQSQFFSKRLISNIKSTWSDLAESPSPNTERTLNKSSSLNF